MWVFRCVFFKICSRIKSYLTIVCVRFSFSCYQIFQGLYPTDVFFAPTVSTTGEEDLDNYQSTDIVDVETQVEDGVESKSNSVANHSIDLTVSSECDVNGIRSELV